MQTLPNVSARLARAQLRAINHRVIHALVVPDDGFMNALVGHDFLFIGCDGAWADRAGYLARMQAPTALSRASCGDVRVRLYGPVALVQGTVQSLLDDGLIQRLRFSDVYLRRDSDWWLVNSQHTTVQPGVPMASRTGVAPQIEPWSGQDPTGDDTAVLHLLNTQYVQAYRDADVAWYDAHFASDYCAVQGDGTITDRAASLARFAIASYAREMQAFPVDKVVVRRFADVALIHAENAYTLKDGRQGISRYTDIWNRQRAGWRCVAAHITEYQEPVMA